MITQSIKLYEEPPPKTITPQQSTVFALNESCCTEQDIVQALEWAKACGISKGLKFKYKSSFNDYYMVEGIQSDHSKIYFSRGSPCIFKCGRYSSTTNQRESTFSASFSVDDILSDYVEVLA